MPCIFCIAVFAMLATAVTTAVLDQLESRLAAEAAGPVRCTTNSSSVSRFEFDFPVPPSLPDRSGSGKVAVAPIALTVYKRHGRVRIQVLTHDLQPAQAEALQRRIAELAGLQILAWSNPQTERLVHDAVEATVKAEAADPDALRRPWS